MAAKSEMKDLLTGLPKNDEFEEVLRTVVDLKGTNLPISLAFFDIDHFLEVNESCGHNKGDQVLKGVTDCIISIFPENKDWIYRIGGDEFAVILNETEKEEAFLSLEEARKAVSKLKMLENGSKQPTISIGVATFPDDGNTRQEIIRKADDALFRAKTSGRNKVALAREEKKIPKTTHFTQGQLDRLSALAGKEGVGEAELLREALDDLLKKYSS